MRIAIFVLAAVMPLTLGPVYAPAAEEWKQLPLIREGKIDPAWRQIGWGGFAVHEDALRTQCDERGMGLLLYTSEKFGDCQIRVVYRVQDAKSNAGVYVRLDDGVLQRIGEKSPPVDRDAQGNLSPEMIQKLMEASEKQLGAWYPVHHGYEVQICDTGDAYHRTGAIYSLAKAAPLPESNSPWRTMIVTLRGETIEVEIDGKPISAFDPAGKDVPPAKHWTEPNRDPPRPRQGYLGLQNHDPGDVVDFKEIAIRPLPETK
jgi:hypothetical protein